MNDSTGTKFYVQCAIKFVHKHENFRRKHLKENVRGRINVGKERSLPGYFVQGPRVPSYATACQKTAMHYGYGGTSAVFQPADGIIANTAGNRHRKRLLQQIAGACCSNVGAVYSARQVYMWFTKTAAAFATRLGSTSCSRGQWRIKDLARAGVQSIRKGHRRGRRRAPAGVWGLPRKFENLDTLWFIFPAFQGITNYDWVCFYDVSGVDFTGDTISIVTGTGKWRLRQIGPDTLDTLPGSAPGFLGAATTPARESGGNKKCGQLDAAYGN